MLEYKNLKVNRISFVSWQIPWTFPFNTLKYIPVYSIPWLYVFEIKNIKSNLMHYSSYPFTSAHSRLSSNKDNWTYSAFTLVSRRNKQPSQSYKNLDSKVACSTESSLKSNNFAISTWEFFKFISADYKMIFCVIILRNQSNNNIAFS